MKTYAVWSLGFHAYSRFKEEVKNVPRDCHFFFFSVYFLALQKRVRRGNLGRS